MAKADEGIERERFVRPSLIRSVGRRALHVMERVLPERTYRAVYGTTFAAYRGGRRAAYARHEVAAALAGDVLRRERARLVRRAMRHSLVGSAGLEATFDAVRQVQERRIPGCLVELGVARGGCAALMRAAANLGGATRHLWLFDSYEGLPEPSARDVRNGATGDHIRPLPAGSCLGTYEDVERLLFDELQFERASISMVKGWFDQTVPAMRAQLGAIAVLRIDADWYESVKTCLDGLYDQVSPGGVIIVDDYGTCYGAQRAVDEFFETRHISPRLEHDGRGGCVWQAGAEAPALQLT